MSLTISCIPFDIFGLRAFHLVRILIYSFFLSLLRIFMTTPLCYMNTTMLHAQGAYRKSRLSNWGRERLFEILSFEFNFLEEYNDSSKVI